MPTTVCIAFGKKQINFINMMERKIGEIFEYKGEWYQCVKSPDGSCNHCDMNFDSKCPIPIKECVASSRSDLSYVIFKKLEKVGEPFVIEKVSYQHYKVFDIDNVYGDGFFWCVHNSKARTLTIELKQNKEEMEEKKLNLKPFDIQKAKAGKPVCTRDGRKARIICFDAKKIDEKNIIALVPSKYCPGFEDLIAYPNNGNYYRGHESDGDLMMLPEKKEMWINIYKSTTNYIPGGSLYDTEEAAKAGADMADDDYIITTKVSWEV